MHLLAVLRVVSYPNTVYIIQALNNSSLEYSTSLHYEILKSLLKLFRPHQCGQ